MTENSGDYTKKMCEPDKADSHSPCSRANRVVSERDTVAQVTASSVLLQGKDWISIRDSSL